MNIDDKQTRKSLFPPDYRASGLLLHVTSLPGPYGIGDLGPVAFRWIDRLREAGQSWWQALPLGPTGYGNSPYQSLSSFAGNWLLISPELLLDEGLLGENPSLPRLRDDVVDYEVVIPFKLDLLRRVVASFKSQANRELKSDFDSFCDEQSHWLEDYALFRVLKARFEGAHYLQWPTDIVERRPSSLARARQEFANEIEQVRLAQFLLFRQGEKLKEYAHAQGIRLIGDLPFFVSSDSADVWAHPEFFQLDECYGPKYVGGVPPDYFSADGQLWGNPVYDWEALRQSGYRWWIDRVRALLAHVDLIRLDHFRGFAAAWHIPAGSTTARAGQWVQGPGAEFFSAVLREYGGLPFVAEDLGIITPDVHALRDQFQIPGTRVLQFAFDGDAANAYLPHNYPANSVVYTGTHDNNTTRGWFEDLPPEQRQRVWNYVQEPATGSEAAVRSLLRLAWSSAAALALAPFQDVLGLGTEARVNVPGRAEGNWRWRAIEKMLSPLSFDTLRDLTLATHRGVNNPAGLVER
jgi:4-alpha-glucanotransferase